MLDEAIAVGRSGSPVDRVVADARTVVRGVFLQPKVTFDAARLGAQITAVADSLRSGSEGRARRSRRAVASSG